MRAMILTLGLAAGLFGTASEAQAQWAYPGYGYGYGNPAYVPSVYGVGRGPFVGGRYLAAPAYGYGYPAVGGYNYGYNSFYRGGYGGFPGGGFGGYPYGGYRSGYRFNFSYGSGYRY